MMPDQENDPLLPLAEAVAKGEPVDWNAAAPAGLGPDDAKVVDAMRVVDAIAHAHSNWMLAEQTDQIDHPEPRRWRHFELGAELGRGSYGVVYRATDTTLGRDVALKLLVPERDTAVALKEARLMTRVRHPNVVTVHGADVEGGRVGIWMELVQGRTLEQVLTTNGPFAAREAAAIGLDLCAALAAVHGAGLVHRDVKARNVVREDGGRIVLMDFGAGEDVAAAAMGGSDVPIAPAGTPLYAAPEVFRGLRPAPTADIYSLGVLLYHLVTRSYPVAGRTAGDVRDAHVRGTRRLLRDERPDLPEAFVRVIERALAPEPAERFESAGAFGEALSQSVGLAPGSNVRPPNPAPSRWRGFVPLALVALVGAGVAWFVNDRPASTSSTAAVQSPPSAAAPRSTPYDIQAVFQRRDERGETPLAWGARVAPGELLSLVVKSSAPAYVYVVNQDDEGRSFLLFPLPGQQLTNPLPANTSHRIPGPPVPGDDSVYWQVTSAGGREHFYVLASPEPQALFEQMVAALPAPREGAPVTSAPLSAEAANALRGVGGLVSAAPSSASLPLLFPTAKPLSDATERVEGLFTRQIVFENPAKR